MTNIAFCFRPSTTTTPTLTYTHAPPPQPTTTTANLTTSLYQTHLGIFSLTWSQTLFTRSLHLHLHAHPHLSLSSPSFHLSLKPFLFWNKKGSKKLPLSPSKSITIFWDLSRLRAGPGPEPEAGFYIAVLFQGDITLLVGDLETDAYLNTNLSTTNDREKIKKMQSLVLRREHVIGKNRVFTTRVKLGGKTKIISIELSEFCEDGPKLVIKFDHKKEVEVKHLKWKFRGSERIEVDGVLVQLSWDVHNWLFDVEDCSNNQDEGCALFTFRFEKEGNDDYYERETERGRGVMWSGEDDCGLKYERKKMKKKMRETRKSASFSSNSMSSVSSSGCSSVLEWESVEENELKCPTGFSLLVYAWKN